MFTRICCTSGCCFKSCTLRQAAVFGPPIEGGPLVLHQVPSELRVERQ
jgi:hypothetical protein